MMNEYERMSEQMGPAIGRPPHASISNYFRPRPPCPRAPWNETQPTYTPALQVIFVVSVWTIFLIAVDRLLVVFWTPKKYLLISTPLRRVAAAAFTWILALFYTFAPVLPFRSLMTSLGKNSLFHDLFFFVTCSHFFTCIVCEWNVKCEMFTRATCLFCRVHTTPCRQLCRSVVHLISNAFHFSVLSVRASHHCPYPVTLLF